MDVVCDRCRAEYEFDDALVSERGTTVKCTNCGHQFKIYRPASHPDGVRSWSLRRPDGTVIPFDSLAVLQKWILEGRVSKMDEICRGSEPWKPLGAIAELESFFSTAEIRASQIPSVPRPSIRAATAAPAGRSPPKVPTPASASGAARMPLPPFTGNTLRPGAMPHSSTAHGYAAPPPPPDPPNPPAAPSTRSDPGDTARTAPVATSSLPTRPTAELGGVFPPPAPRGALSTVDGDALANLGRSGVAISAPTSRLRTETTSDSSPRARPESSPDHEIDIAPVVDKRRFRRVFVGLSLGVLVVAGLCFGLWRLGALSSGARDVGRAAVPTPSPASSERLESARRMANRYTRQSLEDAREELTRALARAPADAETLSTRAYVMAQWGELLRQRADDLDVRAATAGEDVATLRAEAAVLRRDAADRIERGRQDVQMAEVGVGALRGAARASTEALLADVARIAGDVAGAQRHLESARSAGGGSLYFELSLAFVARETGLGAQALEGLRGVVLRGGGMVRARLALARMLASQGDSAGARRELDTVLQSDPDHEDAKLLAQALTRNEPPMATSAASIAAEDGGAQPDVAVSPANLRDHSSNASNAAPTGSGRSYEQLVDDGDRYQDEGRASQARERYRAALALRPSGSEALAGLGLVDIEDGEFSSAVSNFRRSLASNPQYGEALVGLGRAYASQGSYQQAADAYQRYIQNHPGGQYVTMARRQYESLQERLHPSPSEAMAADAGAMRN